MWEKITNRDEKVELELSSAERKLLLTGLVFLMDRVEKAVRSTPAGSRSRSASAIWMTWPVTLRRSESREECEDRGDPERSLRKGRRAARILCPRMRRSKRRVRGTAPSAPRYRRFPDGTM